MFIVADATVAELRLMAMLCMFRFIVYLDPSKPVLVKFVPTTEQNKLTSLRNKFQ